MTILVHRRRFLITAGAAFAAGFVPVAVAAAQDSPPMYGLIGKMLAAPGQRDALMAILLESTDGMPGCLSYVIARDQKDEGAIWITEVWDSKASHDASLSLPQVRDAINRAKPLIAGFGDMIETSPAGGHGLGAG